MGGENYGSGWSPCLNASCGVSAFPMILDDGDVAVGIFLLSLPPWSVVVIVVLFCEPPVMTRWKLFARLFLVL